MANRNFINDDFLLTNQTSRNLYHEYAAKMPIIDYHCHLPPEEIADDKRGAQSQKYGLMETIINGEP